MGVQKYTICPHYGRELKRNRENFKRSRNKETGKEEYHIICRDCETQIEYGKHWDGDKLRCLVCGRSLDPSEFDSHQEYAIRGHRDGRCKECKRKQNQEARENYDDKKRLYKTIQARVLGASERAKRKGIPCTITKEFILDLWNKQNGICALSGIPMTYLLKEGRIPTNISIDKIDRTKGYTIGNIQLVCMVCNQIKSDLTEEEMYNFCKKIVEIYENKNNKNTRPV